MDLNVKYIYYIMYGKSQPTYNDVTTCVALVEWMYDNVNMPEPTKSTLVSIMQSDIYLCASSPTSVMDEISLKYLKHRIHEFFRKEL